jgi:hypothetical protein
MLRKIAKECVGQGLGNTIDQAPACPIYVPGGIDGRRGFSENESRDILKEITSMPPRAGAERGGTEPVASCPIGLRIRGQIQHLRRAVPSIGWTGATDTVKLRMQGARDETKA